MGFKVLIADDEKDIVEMLSAFFTGKGYDILTAYNGEEILGKNREPAGYYFAGCEYAWDGWV